MKNKVMCSQTKRVARHIAWSLAVLMATSACLLLEREQDIDLEQVPASILAAAQNAVPGIAIESAEFEFEDGAKHYEFEGSKDGVEYEIEVSLTGEILEIEAEDEKG